MTRVPLASHGLRAEDIDAAVATLQSGQLTMGSSVADFEHEVAEYLGFEYFVMMNSGSSANLAMFEALMRPSRGAPALRQGDSVIVPAVAWPTTIWPLVQLGLRPLFVDISPTTLGLDLEKAEDAINLNRDRTVKAIFPIHPLGNLLPSNDLQGFAKKHGLILLSDVCESLGSFEDGLSGHAGLGSEALSVSFYFSHHITTMEGGGVATNNLSLRDDLISIRSHGWSRSRSDAQEWQDGVEPVQQPFLFVTSGYNLRPMEVQAAIGRRQLRSVEEFIARRREIAAQVAQGLRDARNLQVLFLDKALCRDRSNSWMHIPIRVVGDGARERRNLAAGHLKNMQVETRPLLTGNFLRQPAQHLLGLTHEKAEDYVVAEQMSNSTFLVGCHHDLDPVQVDYLVSSLKEVDGIIG